MAGRRVDPELLVGSREIAERVGARHTQHIQTWMQHDPTFPPPVAVLGKNTGRPTYIWYWPDIARWAETKGRIPRSKPGPKGSDGNNDVPAS